MCVPRKVLKRETREIMSQKILELKQEHVVQFVYTYMTILMSLLEEPSSP
jgi:hypothetical protein